MKKSTLGCSARIEEPEEAGPEESKQVPKLPARLGTEARFPPWWFR